MRTEHCENQLIEDIKDALPRNAGFTGVNVVFLSDSSKSGSFKPVQDPTQAGYLVAENYYGYRIMRLEKGVPVAFVEGLI